MRKVNSLRKFSPGCPAPSAMKSTVWRFLKRFLLTIAAAATYNNKVSCIIRCDEGREPSNTLFHREGGMLKTARKARRGPFRSTAAKSPGVIRALGESERGAPFFGAQFGWYHGRCFRPMGGKGVLFFRRRDIVTPPVRDVGRNRRDDPMQKTENRM